MQTDQFNAKYLFHTVDSDALSVGVSPNARGIWKYSQNNKYYMIWRGDTTGLGPTYGHLFIDSLDSLDDGTGHTNIKDYTIAAGYTPAFAVCAEIGNVMYFAWSEIKTAAGPNYDAKLYCISYTHATTTWSALATYDIADQYYFVYDIMAIAGQVYVVGTMMSEGATTHWHTEIRKWDNSATATDTVDIEPIGAGAPPYMSPDSIDADDDYQFIVRVGGTSY
jgi:hypothetical protein